MCYLLLSLSRRTINFILEMLLAKSTVYVTSSFAVVSSVLRRQ